MADDDHTRRGPAPILRAKHYSAPSVFRPENLLREARRQKSVPLQPIPEICLLDPDGDIVRYLQRSGRATRHLGWACYHTDLYRFEHDGECFGIVGCAVGAPFAVLIAEEMFASGARLLLSMTSAGQIVSAMPPPCYVIIDRALRDEAPATTICRRQTTAPRIPRGSPSRQRLSPVRR